MKKLIYYLLIILFVNQVLSCSFIKGDDPLEVDYKPLKKNACEDDDYRNGEVVMYFYYGFKNDSLTIFKDSSVFLKGLLTSGATTGLAGSVELGSINDIDSIGIKINNSSIKVVKCDSINHLFLVRRLDKNSIIIESKCYIPNFY